MVVHVTSVTTPNGGITQVKRKPPVERSKLVGTKEKFQPNLESIAVIGTLVSTASTANQTVKMLDGTMENSARGEPRSMAFAIVAKEPFLCWYGRFTYSRFIR